MSNNQERLQRQYGFLTEIDKLKSVERKNIITGSGRRENSAEHSWHLALLALILAEHSPEPLDLARVVKMLLIHDLVEIDAGDCFVHTPTEQQQQHEREAVAARRVFGMLPEDQAADFLRCWEEFEAGTTPEAKFAKAIDRVQPALLHAATDCVAWQRNGLTRSQIWNRMKEVRENTPVLWEKVRSIIETASAKGRLVDQ